MAQKAGDNFCGSAHCAPAAAASIIIVRPINAARVPPEKYPGLSAGSGLCKSEEQQNKRHDGVFLLLFFLGAATAFTPDGSGGVSHQNFPWNFPKMLANPQRLACAFWFIPQKIFRRAPPPGRQCHRPLGAATAFTPDGSGGVSHQNFPWNFPKMLANPQRLACAFWFIPQKIFRRAPPPGRQCHRPVGRACPEIQRSKRGA